MSRCAGLASRRVDAGEPVEPSIVCAKTIESLDDVVGEEEAEGGGAGDVHLRSCEPVEDRMPGGVRNTASAHIEW